MEGVFLFGSIRGGGEFFDEVESGESSGGDRFDDGRTAGFAIAGVDEVFGRFVGFGVCAASDGANDERKVGESDGGVWEGRPFAVDLSIFVNEERFLIAIAFDFFRACHAVWIDSRGKEIEVFEF